MDKLQNALSNLSRTLQTTVEVHPPPPQTTPPLDQPPAQEPRPTSPRTPSNDLAVLAAVALQHTEREGQEAAK